MNNYIISLPNANIRQKHILKEFKKQNIPFEFFTAISPQNKLKELLKQYPNLDSDKMTDGEKSCLLSHFCLWKKCVSESIGYITIFEDDIILGNNANLFFTDYYWLIDRFDLNKPWIIRTETFLMSSIIDKQTSILPFSERNFDILQTPHLGTAGYIISKPAANILLNYFENIKQSELEAIDDIIFNKLLKYNIYTVYQLNPAICIQELQLNKEKSKLTSDIQDKRQELRILLERNKKNLTYRLKRIKDNMFRLFIRHKLKKNQKEKAEKEVLIRFL